MIEVRNLTKRYGDVVAVDDISFTVPPGVVTGFLGPNGAGKSTTMRIVLGLDRPTSGGAFVNGHPFVDSLAPMHELGALLDAKAVDKGRTARSHLRALGATLGLGSKAVDQMLHVVGLTEVADKAAGAFSLGMAQRLGIASALLADPQVVMLDEPVNGLDPDGIRWIRGLLKGLAAEGRTVLISSHLMSEMEMTAEHLVVIGRGRILADVSMAEFIAGASTNLVVVVSPDAGRLTGLLAGPGVTVTSSAAGRIEVTGLAASEIGDRAAKAHVTLHELATEAASLESAFMELTANSVQFAGDPEALDSHINGINSSETAA